MKMCYFNINISRKGTVSKMSTRGKEKPEWGVKIMNSLTVEAGQTLRDYLI